MRMRTFLFCLIAVVLGCVLAFSREGLASEKNFDGVWEYTEHMSGVNVPYSVYRITLREVGDDEIVGHYCFVTQAGNRIDCNSDESENNISGRILETKTRAIVHFYSFFGARDGVAELTLTGKDLTWKVTADPKGGFFYGPYNIKLTKMTPNVHKGERKIVTDQAFLYTSPAIDFKSKAYIIKGDYVKLISLSDDRKFWKVLYRGKNGKILLRWVECGAIDFCP